MLYRILREFLFMQDPEVVHEMTIKGLKLTGSTPLSCLYTQKLPSKPVTVMGLTFDNPVGLAAGMDKNGESIDAFAAMGFGFIEVGTVTPLPQSGNEKPRIFRITQAEAIINRMGFNNAGVDALVENVKKSNYKGILGINIGKNKDTPIEKGNEDYLICMDKVYQYASYITINISSPNTPGLRTLQYGEALDGLLSCLKKRQAELTKTHEKYVPLAVKIAPDLTDEELAQVAKSLVKYKMDGVIATNTTLDRTLVHDMSHASEAGGLSGRPLQHASTEIVRKLAVLLDGQLPIIGVGGIDSVVAAKEKFVAGAELVQVYSGFIYKGPKLVKNIVKSL
ncbi:quinone-dependent dihydroorotate dehydrogenase [Moritella yayanosii]|uniref:Dihydroorotate dehydrogenase (quinone) n=1 Tax=Moritella yayanosii TaxID=69539 RepID=A0A330LKH2_9GAMM|nr:quinone-dependent dihydroorotate dehydrogenase [Moritella yayanosii]SQD77213.1 dihydro-orotate oxidase, FMN-linked [Moritella yayanosii]